MFSGKEVVIFDLDGTLVDSIGMWNDVDSELIKRGGKIPRKSVGTDRDDFLANNTIGNIYENYAKYLKESYSLSLTVEEINFLRNMLSKDYLKNSICLKPNAHILLKELYNRGYTLVLATIGSKWVVDIYMNENKNIVDICNIQELFESRILTKEDVSKKKPDPEVYFKAMEIVNAKPEKCIVVEDSLSGVQAAKAAGIEVICVYDKYSDIDREKINSLANYNVDNYDELIQSLKQKEYVLKKKE